jgi:predicted DNA-binding transcriptional regulator AlpA
MTNRFLSFADLQAARIVSNRTQLSRLIRNYGFPPGFLLTSNTRRWDEEKITKWVEMRRSHSMGEGASTPIPENDTSTPSVSGDKGGHHDS